MTELSPASHILLPSTKNKMAGSCGVPVASTLTKLVDTKTGKTVGRNAPGELCVKGPQVCLFTFQPNLTLQNHHLT